MGELAAGKPAASHGGLSHFSHFCVMGNVKPWASQYFVRQLLLLHCSCCSSGGSNSSPSRRLSACNVFSVYSERGRTVRRAARQETQKAELVELAFESESRHSRQGSLRHERGVSAAGWCGCAP